MFRRLSKFAFARGLEWGRGRGRGPAAPSSLVPGQSQVRRSGTKVESEAHDVFKDVAPPPFVRLVPLPKYGGEYLVTLLTGSTIIGQQGGGYIKSLFETAKVPVVFEQISVGESNQQEFVMSVMRNRAAIHIDLQHDPVEKHKSLRLNNDLDLYACVVKMHSFNGYRCKFPDLDISLIMQNNTGDYSKLEYEPVPGMVETLKFNQDTADRRYLEFVFAYARRNCRKKITFAHQISMLPLADGMFLDIACEIQRAKYPDIEIEPMAVNKMVRHLVMRPQSFDLICTSDRYGTFIASICSAVCGGASLFSATELGDHHAVFKPLQTKLSVTDARHLSPYGIVRSCVDLLVHLGNVECAHMLWAELLKTMLERDVKTEEFGGCDSGEFVICTIVNNLKCKFA